ILKALGVKSVAFSPDGKHLAAGGHDKTVRIWDAETGKETLTLQGHTDTVFCVAYSHDGKRLASATKNQTVKVWELATGHAAITLRPRVAVYDDVLGVAFSPDGKHLAATNSSNVRIWDVTTGNEVRLLKAGAGRVTSVAFSRDGKRLASASKDQRIAAGKDN